MKVRLAGVVLALAVALVIPAAALAQSPDTQSASIHMRGRALVGRDEEDIFVQFSVTSEDDWRMTALVSLAGFDDDGEGFRRQSPTSLDFLGPFALSGPDGQLLQGSAELLVNREGKGTLQLTDDPGTTFLRSRVELSDSGSVELELKGNLPAPAVSPRASEFQAGAAAASLASQADSAPASHTFWYLSRSAAFTAYLLLFANMCTGILQKTGAADRAVARWRIFDLHQFTALLALAAIGLHVLSLPGDQYFNFNLASLFVPAMSPYRPAWTAIGVVSLYLLAAVTGSFYVRRYIGQRTWRGLHFFSFAAFAMVLAHGVLAGTDTVTGWGRLIYVSTGLGVATLTLWRFGRALGWRLPVTDPFSRAEARHRTAA